MIDVFLVRRISSDSYGLQDIAIIFSWLQAEGLPFRGEGDPAAQGPDLSSLVHGVLEREHPGERCLWQSDLAYFYILHTAPLPTYIPV
jgi:hypothetical protein